MGKRHIQESLEPRLGFPDRHVRGSDEGELRFAHGYPCRRWHNLTPNDLQISHLSWVGHQQAIHLKALLTAILSQKVGLPAIGAFVNVAVFAAAPLFALRT